VVFKFVVLLSWKKAMQLGSFSLCYNFDTKEYQQSSNSSSSVQVLRLIRMPVARYCLIIELVRVKRY
jgi:hypothetical protein